MVAQQAGCQHAQVCLHSRGVSRRGVTLPRHPRLLTHAVSENALQVMPRKQRRKLTRSSSLMHNFPCPPICAAAVGKLALEFDYKVPYCSDTLALLRAIVFTSIVIALAAVDQLVLQPIKRIEGHVKLPGSKSLSNRILLLAALSKGVTEVQNLLVSSSIAPYYPTRWLCRLVPK